VHRKPVETGLLRELALRRSDEVLVFLDESPRQRPAPAVRRCASPDRENAELVIANREDDEVDRYCERHVSRYISST
jgi:hypothetical protein